jgi:hypothetical protein
VDYLLCWYPIRRKRWYRPKRGSMPLADRNVCAAVEARRLDLAVDMVENGPWLVMLAQPGFHGSDF